MENTASSFAVVEAMQQVVTSFNYQLELMITDQDDDCMGGFEVVVSDDGNTLTIAGWGGEISCEDADLIMQKLSMEGAN